MSKKFIVYDRQGNILRTGFCPSEDFVLQINPEEFIIEGEACCANDSVDPTTKQVVHGGSSRQHTKAVNTAPPSLSAVTQLDLLWQAMDAGTFPKAEPFYSAIKAQKETAA